MCYSMVDLGPVDDAGVIDAMAEAGRRENAACAAKLAAMGELYARRSPDDDAERTNWAIDGFADLVAEIGVALRISRGRASGQLRYAIALREQLPAVAAVFASGEIDMRMVATIVARVELLDDAAVTTRVDAVLGRTVSRWARLSAPKLIERIDAVVARFDAAGVRAPRERRAERSVFIWPSTGGMADVHASITLPDAVVLDDRLDAMAAGVCCDDPRTVEQRRADALAALGAGRTRLACACDTLNCPARGSTDATAPAQVVLHVIAEQASLDGGAEPGYLRGFGPLPAEMIRELATTAKLTPLVMPSAAAETGYRPSAALAEFVRARDLTCRFPGCDKPAQVCQIDHTVAWPAGPTHPSNLKLLCVYHHLLKTFWSGPAGWTDRQLPDGTILWTAATGHTYTTTPDGALWFPALAIPTAELPLPDPTGSPAHPGRGAMMPRRRRTRRTERRYRITGERAINETRLAEQHRQHQAWLAANDEPPPF